MKINSWFFQMSHLSTFDTKQKFLTAFIPGVICWTRKTLNLKKRSKMVEVNRSTFSCFTFNLKKVVHFLLNSYLIGGVFISIPMPNNRNISSKREREREMKRENDSIQIWFEYVYSEIYSAMTLEVGGSKKVNDLKKSISKSQILIQIFFSWWI